MSKNVLRILYFILAYLLLLITLEVVIARTAYHFKSRDDTQYLTNTITVTNVTFIDPNPIPTNIPWSLLL